VKRYGSARKTEYRESKAAGRIDSFLHVYLLSILFFSPGFKISLNPIPTEKAKGKMCSLLSPAYQSTQIDNALHLMQCIELDLSLLSITSGEVLNDINPKLSKTAISRLTI
jgi:hypothetical protein